MQLHLDDSGPPPLFEESRKCGLNLDSARLVDKLVEPVMNDLPVAQPQQLHDWPIHCTKLAVERNSQREVVEGIDQLLEAALRAGNELAQLIELLLGGGGSLL